MQLEGAVYAGDLGLRGIEGSLWTRNRLSIPISFMHPARLCLLADVVLRGAGRCVSPVIITCSGAPAILLWRWRTPRLVAGVLLERRHCRHMDLHRVVGQPVYTTVLVT